MATPYTIYNSANTAIIVNEDGELYIFSKEAKKVWTGKLEVQDLPETSAGITANMIQPMKILANSNRSLLEDMGMGEDIIQAVLKD